MIVCIEKTPDGQFSVYQENEPASAEQGETQEEPADKQPAPDLNTALTLAGKMLSQSGGPDQAQQMFDQGVAKTAPNRPGMM